MGHVVEVNERRAVLARPQKHALPGAIEKVLGPVAVRVEGEEALVGQVWIDGLLGKVVDLGCEKPSVHEKTLPQVQTPSASQRCTESSRLRWVSSLIR